MSDDSKPDIVLLHLAEPVDFTEDVRPIQIISSSKAKTIYEGAQAVTLVGWGRE